MSRLWLRRWLNVGFNVVDAEVVIVDILSLSCHGDWTHSWAFCVGR
jgi:hypothetical protein